MRVSMDCEVQSSRFNDFSSEFDDDDLEEDDFSSGEISINGQLVISGSPMMFSCSGGTFGRGIVFLPEDKEDGDEEDLSIDSICRGHGISLTNNPQNVEFQVVSFRIHEDKPKSKHVYYSLMVLRTDGIDSDRAVVERRYSDFYALYKALKKDYSKLLAGVNFPSKVIGQKSNLNPETIESRRRAFEFFLQQVYHHKEICHHDAFREFFYIPDLRQATESLKGGELMDSLKRLLNCLHLQVKLCDKVREIVATLGAIVVVYEGQGRFEEAERYATAGIELVQDDFTCCYTIPLLHKAAQLRWKLQIEKKTIEKHLSLVQRMSGIEVDHAFTLKELAVSRFDKKS